MTTNDIVTSSVNQGQQNKLVNLSLTPLEEPKITGLKLDGEIALYRTDTQEELVLNTIDGNDTLWVTRDLDGWWTLPEIELPNLVRGRGDGSYDATGRYSERVITLEGSFLPQGPSGASTARDALINILSPLTKSQDAGYLIVSEYGDSIPISDAQEQANAQIVVLSVPDTSGISVDDRVHVSRIEYSDPDGLVSNYQPDAANNFNSTSEGFLVTAVGDDSITIDRGSTLGAYTGASYTSGGRVRKVVRRMASKVRLLSRPVITSVTPRGRHDFSLALKAVDPIKYEFIAGDPNGYDTEILTAGVSGTASATITNSGNEAVPIIIEISQNLVVADSAIGSCPRIQIGSEYIDIVAGTDANVQLEIDTYNREALKVTYSSGVVSLVENGRSNLSVLVDWLYLQPGDNTVTLARFPQSTTCTIYYRSGWIG